MPIDANRAYLLRRSLHSIKRASGLVLTLGVKPIDSDHDVFKDLGYSGVESLDISGYEGADHIADLNRSIPSALAQRFSLVYNGGTLEHIFDVPAVLRNIHHLLCDNGIVVHVGPMNGWVEHGFYQFSPTFFADYYHANRYEACRAYMLKACSTDHSVVEAHHYLPGKYDKTPAGDFDGVWNFFMPFVKRRNSTPDAVPQQGFYTRLYGDVRTAATSIFDDETMIVLDRGKVLSGPQ